LNRTRGLSRYTLAILRPRRNGFTERVKMQNVKLVP
jgi:hypothetical protein